MDRALGFCWRPGDTSAPDSATIGEIGPAPILADASVSRIPLTLVTMPLFEIILPNLLCRDRLTASCGCPGGNARLGEGIFATAEALVEE